MLKVKIQLPNSTRIELDNNLSLEEKKRLVEELIEEWKPIIESGWESNSVKYFLDSLTNYLVWHKEEEDKGKEDKYIMSKKKLDKLSNHRKDSKTINFSNLNMKDKEMLFGESRGVEQ